MNRKIIKTDSNILFAGLVAIIMLTCTIPFVTSDDTGALTGSNNLSLNTTSVVIYVDTSSSPNTYTFTVSGVPTTQAQDVVWVLNDLDDGTNIVSMTASGITATVTAVSPGTVEIEAYLGDGTEYYASAVIVVFQSSSTPAQEFYFYIKIDSTAYQYVSDNYSAESTIVEPAEMAKFNKGFWSGPITRENVLQDDSYAEFNALTALQWYANNNSWENDIGNYGWINTFLGLSTYEGESHYDSDGNYTGMTYYYWAQYHGTDTGWAFNNTTLQYITTQGSKYIGLIFWGSPDENTMPIWPGYPEYE